MLLVLIPTVCILIVVSIWVSSKGREDFIARATGEMLQVNNVIDILLDNAILNLEMMCTHPAASELDNTINNFSKSTGIVDLKKINRNKTEKALFDHFTHIIKTHPDYIELYLGTRWSGFISNDDAPLKTPYNPTIRPWYNDALKEPGKALIAKAYLSTNGENVIAAVKAYIRMQKGKFFMSEGLTYH